MKKILIPIDGTERSEKSIEFVLKIFPKESVDITLMNVKELVLTNTYVFDGDEVKNAENRAKHLLETTKEKLEGYRVDTFFSFGNAGRDIIEKSIVDKYDAIVMTKSTKKNFIDSIGSVTNYVVKKSKCTVIIVPE